MIRIFRSTLMLLALSASLFFLSGCSYKRMVVDFSAPVVDQMSDSFNANCDISILKESMPFTLSGLSGLIDASPTNTSFLIHGSNAYFAYSFAFI